MNPIKDPIKDTLVPLRTNSNANGFVRWRTSVYLNPLHRLMGKDSCNCNGVCTYVPALFGIGIWFWAVEILGSSHYASVVRGTPQPRQSERP